MVFDRKLGTLFDKVPSIYHSSRKGYPAQVFFDIIKFSKINKKSYILDIGCGSGLSTLPFAKKGYDITGIDISKEMIEMAKNNAHGYKNLKYIASSFETYNFKSNRFDLIISGQAFQPQLFLPSFSTNMYARIFLYVLVN